MKNLSALFAVVVCLLSFQTSHATIWDVIVVSFAYQGSPATVTVGDTIRWSTIDVSTHTVTSSTVPAGAAHWDHALDQFNTTNFYVVTVAGTYTYYCIYHPMMTATFTAQLATGVSVPVVADANLFAYADANRVNVSYTVRETADTRLALSDLSGKTFYSVQHAAQAAGVYTTAVDAAVLPKGVYLVSVQIGEAVLTRKVTVN
jgi:plastocyanin